MVRILRQEEPCEWPGCEQPAVALAIATAPHDIAENDDGEYDQFRGQTVRAYCESHASEIVNRSHPEYAKSCPNCGCRFGVG